MEPVPPVCILLGLASVGTAISFLAGVVDIVISALQKPEVEAIMKQDDSATQHFTDVLDGLGVTSDRLKIWIQQHQQYASQRKGLCDIDILVMYEMFAAIREAQKYLARRSDDQKSEDASADRAANEALTIGAVLKVITMTGLEVALNLVKNVCGYLRYRFRNPYGDDHATNDALTLAGTVLKVVAKAPNFVDNVCIYYRYLLNSRKAKKISQKVSILEREKRFLGRVYHECEQFL